MRWKWEWGLREMAMELSSKCEFAWVRTLSQMTAPKTGSDEEWIREVGSDLGGCFGNWYFATSLRHLSSLPVGVDATQSWASTAATLEDANLIVAAVFGGWGGGWGGWWDGCRGSTLVRGNAWGGCGRSHILDATVAIVEVGNTTASARWLAAASGRGHCRGWVAGRRVTATWRLRTTISATTTHWQATAKSSASTRVSTTEATALTTSVASCASWLALCNDRLDLFLHRFDLKCVC